MSFIDNPLNIILEKHFSMVSKQRLVGLYNKCIQFNNTNYSFVECGVAKGGCLAIMKIASSENNKIFGFDSFEGMPKITSEDLGTYNKYNPISWVGKLNENGINDVYYTFNHLKLNMNNVELIKGFFQETMTETTIENLGKIAILRLDNDWYKSTKFCIEKLYDNVVNGGFIIIDDYGAFIGCKRAIDEFRTKHFITSPLIKTDEEEYYWIKQPSKYIIQIGSHIGNTWNDPLFNCISSDVIYILIEPVPYLFEQLQKNYHDRKNVILLNIAVSVYEGILKLYIPSESNNFNVLPIYSTQLASVNKNHLTEHISNLIIDEINVPCKTVNQIIKEYNINDLESIYIDTEGHDYEILMDLDLSLIKPKNIIFENKHMDGVNSYLLKNREKYSNLLKHFHDNGYKIVKETLEDTFITLK